MWDQQNDKDEQPTLTVMPDGTQEWRLANGDLHRVGAPALIGPETEAGRIEEWFQNGVPHREDGPAYIGPNGYQMWCQYGKKHRVGAPAVRHIDGSEEWYLEGERHNENGPAVMSVEDGHTEWWLNGKRVSSLRFLARQMRKHS